MVTRKGPKINHFDARLNFPTCVFLYMCVVLPYSSSSLRNCIAPRLHSASGATFFYQRAVIKKHFVLQQPFTARSRFAGGGTKGKGLEICLKINDPVFKMAEQRKK